MLDSVITVVALCALFGVAVVVVAAKQKARAYGRLLRMRRYQALADERNPRTRAIRKFSNARVVRQRGSDHRQHATTAYASRPLLRVIVTGKARGSDPSFGG